MTAGSGGRGARRWPGAAGLALAVALAAVFWTTLWSGLDARSVLTRVPVLDEAHYLREAHAIAGGRLVPDGPFVMSPLYPYLVAATGGGRDLDAQGLRRGPPPHGTRAMQAVLWAATVVLLRLAARRLVADPWAWLPPLLFALYAPAAVYATTVLLEVPLVFCTTAALVLLTPARGQAVPPSARSWARALGLGVLIGAGALLRPTAALLLAPAALVLARAPAARDGGRGRGRPSVRLLAALAAGALLAIAPVVAHNSRSTGRLAGVSLNGGMNLYIGQGPGANGFFRTFAGFQFEADPAGVAFLSGRLGRPVAGPGEADRIWLAQTWEYVADHPLPALGLWAKKVWLHFTAPEIDQVTPLAAWRRDGPPLRLLVAPYGALAALGIAGLVLVAGRPAWRPWVVALGLMVAAQSAFFVVSRYRLVLVPILALLAAGWAEETARRRGRARVLAAALALAGGLAVVPWGLGDQRAAWRALGLANEARRWARLEGPAAATRAEALYREAIEADPTQAQAHLGLARELLRSGRQGAAEEALAAGALRADQPGLLQRDLALLRIRRSDFAAALPLLAAVLRDQPADAEAVHALSLALQGAGRVAEALEAARRFVALRPDDSRGYVDLGTQLARAGRRDEARAVFAEGLRRCPDSAELRHNLEVLEDAPDGVPAR